MQENNLLKQLLPQRFGNHPKNDDDNKFHHTSLLHLNHNYVHTRQ